jgi:hypothetical protein
MTDGVTKQDEINRCLDEIEAAYRVMVKNKSDKKALSNARGWVRKHKAILKELGYKGEIPRQPRIMKKYSEKGDLFNEVERLKEG